MDVALKHILEKEVEPFVIIAKKQTEGRGRENKNWHSLEGGLYASFVLPIKESLTEESFAMFHYSTALAIVTCLNQLFETEIKIKWPNDIYFEGKKLGGLLIEYITNEHNFLVIGVGINVNNTVENFPKNIKENSTSLTDILSRRILTKEIIDSLKKEINRYSEYVLEFNFKKIVDQFNQNCVQYKKELLLKNEEKYVCKGINLNGRFIIVSDKEKKKLKIEESSKIAT
jgi:BirA family biotin operon repressor/biotin-[acetyl-CoA-carboxylase] ligase